MILFTVKNCVHQAKSLFLKQCAFYSTILNNTCGKDVLVNNDNNLLQSGKKCVSVAFIGLPNVGKSTLINQLTHRSICPTSSKMHTTMHKAEAMYVEDDTQIVFMDTPGLTSHQRWKKYKLAESFKEDPAISIKEADVVGIIQDVTWIHSRSTIYNFIFDYLQHKREDTPLLLILNKVDILKKKQILLQITKDLMENKDYPKFDEVFMISALKGDGVDDLRNYLLDSAKVKEWKYEKDHYTDQPIEKLIQQTVRAKLMDLLPNRVPYAIKLELEHFEYTDDGGFSSTIILNCPNQCFVKMLLKNKGDIIKMLSFYVEKELRNAFRKTVIIRLIVKREKRENQSTTPAVLKT